MLLTSCNLSEHHFLMNFPCLPISSLRYNKVFQILKGVHIISLSGKVTFQKGQYQVYYIRKKVGRILNSSLTVLTSAMKNQKRENPACPCEVAFWLLPPLLVWWRGKEAPFVNSLPSAAPQKHNPEGMLTKISKKVFQNICKFWVRLIQGLHFTAKLNCSHG